MGNKLGEYLRAQREQRYLSLRDIAQITDYKISAATLSRLERGQGEWTDEYLRAICPVFDLDFEQTKIARDNPDALVELVHGACKSEWIHIHESRYMGPVWIKISPNPEKKNSSHDIEIRWGPWKYVRVIEFSGYEWVGLVHFKADWRESIPIAVTVDPPAYVEFGQGSLHGKNIQDINWGWKRIEPYDIELVIRQIISIPAQIISSCWHRFKDRFFSIE